MIVLTCFSSSGDYKLYAFRGVFDGFSTSPSSDNLLMSEEIIFGVLQTCVPERNFLAFHNKDDTQIATSIPCVGVIMGSASDWETMVHACEVLDKFGVNFEKRVVSAHRTPLAMVEYATQAASRGLKVIIAGAGGAAHLPGMVASMTSLPVIGVPVQSKSLQGLDSLLSIVQMPGGVPVATMAIGVAGAKNAGLFAVRILANDDGELRAKVDAYMKEQSDMVAKSQLE